MVLIYLSSQDCVECMYICIHDVWQGFVKMKELVFDGVFYSTEYNIDVRHIGSFDISWEIVLLALIYICQMSPNGCTSDLNEYSDLAEHTKTPATINLVLTTHTHLKDHTGYHPHCVCHHSIGCSLK